MDRIYFTITGTSHYYGLDFIKEGMKVTLIKEPDNKADREAIKVEMEGLDTVGHVANSPYTVLGRSFSAGRLYDKIGDTASGTCPTASSAAWIWRWPGMPAKTPLTRDQKTAAHPTTAGTAYSVP